MVKVTTFYEVSPLDSMGDDKDQTGIGDGGGIEGDAKARPQSFSPFSPCLDGISVLRTV